MARASVRRQGEALSREQVTEKVAEAGRRERETGRQLHVAVDRGPYDGDPRDLGEQWAARHAEWRRVAALMDAEDWPVYEPERDVQGSMWVQGREDRRQEALARRAAWQKDQWEAREELKTQVWLNADTSRRLRTIANAPASVPSRSWPTSPTTSASTTQAP
ncbi:hypothetical protein [Streptomyces sp. MMBL 11-3]|uniref:hypothetical protein n=1 Tax=Streptomyces sp. MMBL 11-3 TaxID=3382639 RepID=UPI0039B3BB86